MGFLGGTPKPRFGKVRDSKGKETLLLGQKGVFSLSIRVQRNTIPAKHRFSLFFHNLIFFALLCILYIVEKQMYFAE